MNVTPIADRLAEAEAMTLEAARQLGVPDDLALSLLHARLVEAAVDALCRPPDDVPGPGKGTDGCTPSAS